MYIDAKKFLDKKQDDWFEKHGVYADVNSKIAEWMNEYAISVKEVCPICGGETHQVCYKCTEDLCSPIDFKKD